MKGDNAPNIQMEEVVRQIPHHDVVDRLFFPHGPRRRRSSRNKSNVWLPPTICEVDLIVEAQRESRQELYVLRSRPSHLFGVSEE